MKCKKTTSSHVSSDRFNCTPPKRFKEEDHDSEDIQLLKIKRKSYIVGIAKAINVVTELIDQ